MKLKLVLRLLSLIFTITEAAISETSQLID